MRRRDLLAALASTPLWSLGCPAGTPPLRFSGIPDADKRALKEGYQAVAAYLSAALKTPVEYVHVPDYTAAVTSLASGSIDFAWLGGVTTVQAEARTPGGVHFIAARERDLHFKSYLVANRHAAEEAGLAPISDRAPGTIDALRALAPAMKGKRFSFGAKNSTSGHVMPRSFFGQAGIDPEATFEGGPTYQLKGGHAATLRAVAARVVDFGVLNFATWEDADITLKKEAPVVAVTPEYVDYCLVAHARMPQAQAEALRTALTALDGADETQAKVLSAFSAKRFVEVDPTAWDGIRSVLEALNPEGTPP
ncbi:MAG: PhnD/SsuA/transferrin family substrate-binding protein [Myxococcota bacterium]